MTLGTRFYHTYYGARALVGGRHLQSLEKAGKIITAYLSSDRKEFKEEQTFNVNM